MEKFIEIVKKYPILYDLSHKEYKNIRKKDKIWDEIGLELNENGDILRKRWKNLRDTHAKYIRSQKTKTGQAADLNKKWIWAEQMDFFKKFLAFAPTSSNVTSLEKLQDEQNYIEEIHYDYIEAEYLETDVTAEIIIQSENNETESFNFSCISGSSTPTQILSEVSNKSGEPSTSYAASSISKKGTRNRTVSASSSSNNVSRVIDYIEQKRMQKKDEIESLMLAHAKTIRTFSAKRQIITKMKIAELIMQQELLNLEETTNNVSSDTSASSFYEQLNPDD